MDRHELLSRLRARPDAHAPEIAAAIEVVEAIFDAGRPTPRDTPESAAHPGDVAFAVRRAYPVTRWGRQPADLLAWWQHLQHPPAGGTLALAREAGEVDAAAGADDDGGDL